MDTQSWIEPLFGGGLLGLGGALLWLTLGRSIGVSGIASGVLRGSQDWGWRVAFLGGLATAGAALASPFGTGFAEATVAWPSTPVLGLSGLLVGVGTRVGNGCPSGHGMCGVSRLSTRSITATSVFVGVGMLTVALVRATGGAS